MTLRAPIFLTLFTLLLHGVLTGKPPREIWERYQVAFIGKGGENLTYGPAHQGAIDAAKVLEHEFNLQITIRELTPNVRNGASQNTAIQEAFLMGVEAILISVDDPATIQKELELAARHGVYTVTFDGDAPDAPRLATVESDQHALGSTALKTVAKSLPRGGRLAVLAGNADNPAMQMRITGLNEAAEALEKISIHGIYHCPEDFQGAMEVIQEVVTLDRDEEIDGWVFLGPWPLMGATPLPWPPGEQACVAVDALPPMLTYLANEQVDALVAQMYYRWGYLAMETAILAVHEKKAPEVREIKTGSDIVTKRDLEKFSQDWTVWMQ